MIRPFRPDQVRKPLVDRQRLRDLQLPDPRPDAIPRRRRRRGTGQRQRVLLAQRGDAVEAQEGPCAAAGLLAGFGRVVEGGGGAVAAVDAVGFRVDGSEGGGGVGGDLRLDLEVGDGHCAFGADGAGGYGGFGGAEDIALFGALMGVSACGDRWSCVRR